MNDSTRGDGDAGSHDRRRELERLGPDQVAEQLRAELGKVKQQLEIETRRRAEAESARDDAERRWHSLADKGFDFLILADRQGRIRFINRVADGYEMEDVAGTTVYDWLEEPYQDQMRKAIERTLRTGEFTSVQVAGRGHGGDSTWYHTRIAPHSQQGRVEGVALHVANITTYVKTEYAFRQAEVHFRAVFENAAVGIALCDVKDNCRIVHCNAAFQRLLACEGPAATTGSILNLVHADDVGLFKERVNRMLEGKRSRVRRELRFVSCQGRDLCTRWTASLAEDQLNQNTYLICVLEDISNLKRTEQRLAGDEHLLRRLIDLQDRERQMLAYEIHDGLIQDVIGAQLAMQSLEAAVPRDRLPLLDLLQKAMQPLRRALNEGRRLIGELRPMCLDEMNMDDALEFLVHEAEASSGTQIEFTPRIASRRFDPLLENTIFRIVQESLANIRRHSQSERAEVRFTEINDRQLVLEIQDWGVGFDLDQVPADRFGIESIRERARLMGGRARIESVPGEGTRVTVVLPSLKKTESTGGDAQWIWTI